MPLPVMQTRCFPLCEFNNIQLVQLALNAVYPDAMLLVGVVQRDQAVWLMRRACHLACVLFSTLHNQSSVPFQYEMDS